MSDRAPRFVVTFSERQMSDLRELSTITELSMSELLRRMVDYCVRTEAMDRVVPCMSGRLQVN